MSGRFITREVFGGGQAIVVPGSSYTGIVATNGRMAYQNNTANTQQMSRTHHVKRGTSSTMGLLLGNWYWTAGNTRLETNAGATASVTASIEYPAGTFTQMKFSGSTTATISDGGQIATDLVALVIPDGAEFWVRIWRSCSAGITFNSRSGTTISSPIDTGNGEAMTYGTSVTDQTMGGTVVKSDNYAIHYPLAIIGDTTLPSVYADGDSRTYGQNEDRTGDTAIQATDLGEVARSIGKAYGYFNGGSHGETWASALASGNFTKRSALLAYCTHVVTARGINSIRAAGGNVTLATAQSQAQQMWALFGNKPVYQTTLVTVDPSSTDNWATQANQTQDGNNAVRTGFNDWIRGKPSGIAGYFEVADVVETARNSGYWKTNGTALAYCDNLGLHESGLAYRLIRDSGNLNPAVLTR